MSQQFDSIASQYDTSFSNTSIGKAQRNIVWSYLDKYLPSQPLRILEINCGTGEDAIFFAQKHHHVFATDASEQMLRVAKEKIEQQNLTSNIELAVWDLNQPFPFQNRKFDLIFSNFGGLNCLSPEALKKLSFELNQLLNPGGKLIFVVMGRFCLWETMYFLLKGKFKTAFRRSSKKAVKAKLDETTEIGTWYYSAKGVKNIFSEHFKYVNKKPVGFFVPPSYLETFFSKKKVMLRFLIKMESEIKNFSFLSNCADHYLIGLRKP